MALNLLSDKKDVADTAAAKTPSAPLSVAFRMPVLPHPTPARAEKGVPSPVSVGKKTPPLVKKQKEEIPLEAVLPKARPRPPQGALPFTGYTKPEAAGKGFSVNILGATAEKGAEPSSFALMIIAVVGAFLATALVVGVLSMLIAQEEKRIALSVQAEKMTLDSLKRTIKETAAERKSATERLETIETARALFSRHIYWTRFFRFLEAVTLPDVYYTNLAVDPAGNIRLAAIGRNFSAVARQLLAFEESADVETIRTTKAAAELSGEAAGVQFDLALTVKPELLFNK